MRPYTVKVAAGQSEQIGVVGDFVRVKSASVEIRIVSDDGKADITLSEGDAVTLLPFTRLDISHASASEQPVTLQIGNGTSASSSRVGGSIQLQTVAGMTQTAPGAGIASAQILATNAARRFLMVQNNDPAAVVDLNLAGAAAVIGQGVRLAPGAVLILDACVPSGAIFAISSAATALLTVVEG